MEYIKAIFLKGKCTDLANSFGMMEKYIKALFLLDN